MVSVHINWLAILATTVLAMVIGAIWYSPMLFANPWVKLIGLDPNDKKTMDEMQKGAMPGYLLAVVGNILTAYILVHFLTYAGATTFTQGMATGFWAWLGFFALPSAMSYKFENRPWALYCINVGMPLVNLLLMGGILAVWR